MKRKSSNCQPGNNHTAPDAKVGRYVKLGPADRSCLVQCVFSELSKDQQSLALRGCPHQIEFTVQKRNCRLHDRASELGRALEAAAYARQSIRLAYPPGNCAKQEAGRKAAKRWFNKHYTSPMSHSSFQDLSTQVLVGKDLTEDEWEVLHHVLIDCRYNDENHNARRFSGLEHYVRWQSAMVRATGNLSAKEEVEKIHALLLRSKARGFRHLESAVVVRFKLKTVREQWKDYRDGLGAQNEAKRWSGDLPCGDCYYRKASGARRLPGPNNKRLIRCLPPTPDSGELKGVQPAPYLFYHEPSMNQVQTLQCTSPMCPSCQ